MGVYHRVPRSAGDSMFINVLDIVVYPRGAEETKHPGKTKRRIERT